jgi:hypothetical protein
MSKENRPLLMRANRMLGAELVEHNLVRIEDLETANEKLIEIVASDQPRQCSILGLLAYDMKVLKEDDVLHHLVDVEGVGLVDLRDYDVPDELRKGVDLGACWATWTVPFDREEDFHFVATAYYLSPAVRTYWESSWADRSSGSARRWTRSPTTSRNSPRSPPTPPPRPLGRQPTAKPCHSEKSSSRSSTVSSRWGASMPSSAPPCR